MRSITLKSVEDIHAVWVGEDYTGLQYTKDEMNAMLDDLVRSYKSTKSRQEILTTLIQKSLARAARDFEDGPLTPAEIAEIVRLVEKSCKR